MVQVSLSQLAGLTELLCFLRARVMSAISRIRISLVSLIVDQELND